MNTETVIDPIEAIDLAYTQGVDTWEMMVSVGQSDEEEMGIRRWRQGDLAIRIDKHYGDNTIAKFADAIAVNTSTLKQRKVMSAFYELDTRYRFQAVGYSHFRTAMKLGTLEKAMWALEKADERLWPVWKFERLLNRYLGKNHPTRETIEGYVLHNYETMGDEYLVKIRVDKAGLDYLQEVYIVTIRAR